MARTYSTDESIKSFKTNEIVKINKNTVHEFSFSYDPVIDFRVDIVQGCIVDQIVDTIVTPTDIKLTLNSIN